MVAHPDLNDVLCSGKIEQKHNCTHVMNMVCLLIQVHPYWQYNTSDQHNTVYPAGCLTPAQPCFAQVLIQPGHTHGVPLGSHDLNHALSSGVPCVPDSKSLHTLVHKQPCKDGSTHGTVLTHHCKAEQLRSRLSS